MLPWVGTDHIGALGSLLDGLEEEAGRLAVVLPDEAAVGEHGGEVVGEDAATEGQQVVPRRRRRPERRLLLPHRCTYARTHISVKSINRRAQVDRGG